MSTNEIYWCNEDDIKNFNTAFDITSLNNFLCSIKSRKDVAEYLIAIRSKDQSVNSQIDTSSIDSAKIDNLLSSCLVIDNTYFGNNIEKIASVTELGLLLVLLIINDQQYLNSQFNLTQRLQEAMGLVTKLKILTDHHISTDADRQRMASSYTNMTMIIAILCIFSKEDQQDIEIPLKLLTNIELLTTMRYSQIEVLTNMKVSLKVISNDEFSTSCRTLFAVLLSLFEPFYANSIGSVYPHMTKTLYKVVPLISDRIAQTLINKLMKLDLTNISDDLQYSDLRGNGFLSENFYSSAVLYQTNNSSHDIDKLSENIGLTFDVFGCVCKYKPVCKKLSESEEFKRSLVISMQIMQSSSYHMMKLFCKTATIIAGYSTFEELSTTSAYVVSSLLLKCTDGCDDLSDTRFAIDFIAAALRGPCADSFTNALTSSIQIHSAIRKLIAMNPPYMQSIIDLIVTSAAIPELNDIKTLLLDVIVSQDNLKNDTNACIDVINAATAILKLEMGNTVVSQSHSGKIAEVIIDMFNKLTVNIVSPSAYKSTRRIDAIEAYIKFVSTVITFRAGERVIPVNFSENLHSSVTPQVIINFETLISAIISTISKSLTSQGVHDSCFFECIKAFTPFSINISRVSSMASFDGLGSAAVITPDIELIPHLGSMVKFFGLPVRLFSLHSARDLFSIGLIYDEPMFFKQLTNYRHSLDASSVSDTMLMSRLSSVYFMTAGDVNLTKFVKTVTALIQQGFELTKRIIYAPEIGENRFNNTLDAVFIDIFRYTESVELKAALLEMLIKFTECYSDNYLRYLQSTDGTLTFLVKDELFNLRRETAGLCLKLLLLDAYSIQLHDVSGYVDAYTSLVDTKTSTFFKIPNLESEDILYSWSQLFNYVVFSFIKIGDNIDLNTFTASGMILTVLNAMENFYLKQSYNTLDESRNNVRAMNAELYEQFLGAITQCNCLATQDNFFNEDDVIPILTKIESLLPPVLLSVQSDSYLMASAFLVFVSEITNHPLFIKETVVSTLPNFDAIIARCVNYYMFTRPLAHLRSAPSAIRIQILDFLRALFVLCSSESSALSLLENKNFMSYVEERAPFIESDEIMSLIEVVKVIIVIPGDSILSISRILSVLFNSIIESSYKSSNDELVNAILNAIELFLSKYSISGFDLTSHEFVQDLAKSPWSAHFGKYVSSQ